MKILLYTVILSCCVGCKTHLNVSKSDVDSLAFFAKEAGRLETRNRNMDAALIRFYINHALINECLNKADVAMGKGDMHLANEMKDSMNYYLGSISEDEALVKEINQ